MNRCKTCSHWQPVGPDEYGVIVGTGICAKVLQIWDVVDDDDDSDQRRLKPEHAGLLAMVADGSQYTAELITMPDFGCAMHSVPTAQR